MINSKDKRSVQFSWVKLSRVEMRSVLLQVHWHLWDGGVGAGGAGGAPHPHVERPLQPQHLQLILRHRGGTADHKVLPRYAAILVTHFSTPY